MKVSVPGILDSVSTMKDRTLKLVFRTQELPSDQAGVLHGLVHNQGWCLFADQVLKEADVPEFTPEFKNDKTPGQRLRASIYVLWEQSGKPGNDFDLFYKQRMESLIDFVKSKLQ